ncbi:competence/damage-inducible protein cinA [Haloactinospora alba]|uniref:Competence/damage-inducible protein cinA n=1 Tax=Haloactinospora alba TaxID=405555 RepID=A0A543NGQ1_9ACTN|nr:CinA family protein [Haloactinospora alba]TQN31019.1 competence/damage-inducible protein cinA [Haloactinospora alba]
MSEAALDAYRALEASRSTVATAESLTGGMVGAAITGVPGASAVYLGGVVAYATDAKLALLGVSERVLRDHGAVHPDVARQMARGARDGMSATFGLAVTGVAGPEPQDGQPVGTVFAAVAGPAGDVQLAELHLRGERSEIREATVDQALRLLSSVVGAGASG